MTRARLLQSTCGVLLVLLLIAGCGRPATVPPVRLAGGSHTTDPRLATPWDRYALMFMVDATKSDEIAAFAALCEGMGLSIADGLTATAIPIKDGRFAIVNPDIALSAWVVDSAVITGTLEARSAEAVNCRIPKTGQWKAVCGLETGVLSLWLDGKEVASELVAPCSVAFTTPTPQQ